MQFGTVPTTVCGYSSGHELESAHGASGPLSHSSEHMDPLEGQARAIIAAALIVRGAVEVPSLPSDGGRASDYAGTRLHDLTDYVYRLVTTTRPLDGERQERE